jgi:hypothetical protein
MYFNHFGLSGVPVLIWKPAFQRVSPFLSSGSMKGQISGTFAVKSTLTTLIVPEECSAHFSSVLLSVLS